MEDSILSSEMSCNFRYNCKRLSCSHDQRYFCTGQTVTARRTSARRLECDTCSYQDQEKIG